MNQPSAFAWRPENIDPPQLRRCGYCDEELDTGDPRARYCNGECRYKARYEREGEVLRDRSRRYHDRNRPDRLAANRARRAENLDRYRAADRARYRADPERFGESARASMFWTKYGLARPAVAELIAFGHGLCWICRTRPVEAIDHDHDLERPDHGFVRGGLCLTCNVWLGHIERNDEWHGAARRYLDRSSGNRTPVPGENEVRHKHLAISVAEVERIARRQHRRCAICLQPEVRKSPKTGDSRTLSVDHDHSKRPGEPGYIRACCAARATPGWASSRTRHGCTRRTSTARGGR